MVSKKLSTAVFLCRLLAAALLVSLTSFGAAKSGCQLCFAGDTQGKSASGDLVIISSVGKSSEGKSTSSSSCTFRLDTVQKTLKPKSCTTANTIQVIGVCERLGSQVPAKKMTPLAIPAISIDSGSFSQDKYLFVAALHARAKQSETSFSNDSGGPLGSLNFLPKGEVSLLVIDPLAISTANSTSIDVRSCLLVEENAGNTAGLMEGLDAKEPLNQKFISSLLGLVGQQEERHTGEQVQYVAAEEILSTPVPADLSITPNEQSQQVQELLGPTISNHDWVSNSSDVDIKIINGLSADVRPKLRGKMKSKQGDQDHADEMPKNEMPENFAAQEQGVFENSPFVGVGASRFLRGNVALWAAPKFHHRPLYFEEPNLERYGHYIGGQYIQSAISTAHFFGSIPLLPYKIGASSPRSCNYTLGRFRPGNCNPRVVEIPEFSPRGFMYQSLFTTGAAFVVP